MRNKKKPLISVITAVLNGAEVIERAIKSVVNQTYQNFEYLIIDGGSTDGTVDIIKKYDKKIDLWISEPNNGPTDAVNKGIRLAKGEYIYFLFDDDFLVKHDVLDRVAQKLIGQNPQVAYGQVIHPIKGYGYLIWPKSEVPVRDIRNGQTLPHQALFVKKKVMDRIGPYEDKYGISTDRDIICKCAKIPGKPLFLDMLVAFFDAGGGSSKLHIGNTAVTIYKNFGIVNTMIYYINYAPMMALRYALDNSELLRKYIVRIIAIPYNSLFRKFYPFILVPKNQGDKILNQKT